MTKWVSLKQKRKKQTPIYDKSKTTDCNQR